MEGDEFPLRQCPARIRRMLAYTQASPASPEPLGTPIPRIPITVYPWPTYTPPFLDSQESKSHLNSGEIVTPS